MLAGQCNRILCHDSFPGRRMSGHEYRITHLQVVDCFLLEVIQLKRILLQRIISGRHNNRRCIRKMTYLVSHVWHKLMKVLHWFIYVHYLSPFAFLSVSAPRGAVGCTQRCKLGALGRDFFSSIHQLTKSFLAYRRRQQFIDLRASDERRSIVFWTRRPRLK